MDPNGVSKMTGTEIAQYIDHTLLKPEANRTALDGLCEEAILHRFKAVCVNSGWVVYVAEKLKGTNIAVCSVIGFPLGAMCFPAKAFEARQAVEDGAQELDMVLNIGKLLDGDHDYVKKDIKAVVDVAHRSNVAVKVIFENYYLNDEQKEAACRLAEEAGVDFVKTSTGFADGGATLEDLELMREHVSEKVQVKAAGGVRDLEMALKVRQVGCTRFGATRTETIVEQCHKAKST